MNQSKLARDTAGAAGKLLPAFIALLAIVSASAVMAHHSPAKFRTDQVIVVHGTVVEFDWRNPHAYITVKDSNDLEWLVEANSTANLIRIGWSRDSLQPGETITFRANPNRDAGKTHVSLISVTKSNGDSMDARFSDALSKAGPTVVAPRNLAGVWQGDPAIAFKMLFQMIDHPLTEKGQAAKAAYDESMDPIAQCVVWPTPRLVAWGAFYLIEITPEDDKIIFRSEFDNIERTVHTDGRSHPDTGERTNQGHSIGWWEDDTLVVETTLFADNRSPVADGIPSGPAKRVVERYTRSDDGKSLLVDLLVQDPEFLAEPFESQLVWNYAPHLDMLSFQCIPEVSSRYIQ